MQTLPLQFRLKGKRKYVHGPDIYNAMVGQIAAIYPQATLGSVRLAVHRVATKQCRLIYGAPQESVAKPQDAVAQLQISTPIGAVEAWLVEGYEAILEIIEYDEDRVEQQCSFDENSVRIQGDSGYTTIETVVAMTKFLHQRIYGPDVGKWLFTRVHLNRPFAPTDVTYLRVNFLEGLGDGKLTRSAIYAEDELIGHMYFAARTTWLA